MKLKADVFPPAFGFKYWGFCRHCMDLHFEKFNQRVITSSKHALNHTYYSLLSSCHEGCGKMFAAEILKSIDYCVPHLVATRMVPATSWQRGRSRVVGTASGVAHAQHANLGAFPKLSITARVG